MGTISCTGKSVRNYHSNPRNVLEERRSYLVMYIVSVIYFYPEKGDHILPRKFVTYLLGDMVSHLHRLLINSAFYSRK